MDYAMLGESISARRRALGITQAELAERADVSTAFIGHIERGTRIPSLATTAAIAAALHTTVDALLPAVLSAPIPPEVKQADVEAARRLLALALRLTENS